MDIYIKDDINSKTNIGTTNNNSIINEASESYYYYDYIDITLGDPISSILLSNKYVVIGTMAGVIKLYYFTEKRIYIISKGNIEYISGFSLSEYLLYTLVGDVHYLRYEMKEPFCDYSMPYHQVKLYESNIQHAHCCDNVYVLMSTNNILNIDVLQPELQNSIVEEYMYINFGITYFKKTSNNFENQQIVGKLKSTNYYVPLDFDGSNFCWVEYLNDKEDRNLCIQYLLIGGTIDYIENKLPIDKDFGHINHAKLLKNNKVLVIHKLNLCDIYFFKEGFDKTESFVHLGDEVYSVDIIYNNDLFFKYNDNIKLSIGDSDSSSKVKVSESQKLKESKGKAKNLKNSNSEKKIESLSLMKYNLQNRNEKESNINTAIVTLDIYGNVNKYENNSEEKLFNLYDINGIHQDFKDKQFFDMGYMYFIKTDLNFFCITTDHGCFIIKKKEK